MNRAKLIIPVVLALLNIAVFGINLHNAITTDGLASIASIVFALLSLFAVGLTVVSLYKEYRFRQLKRKAKQVPKFQSRCETIIYFNHSGLKIEAVSFLEHEKEYYETR
ncbi:MAG: hypothetical protein K6G73_12525 [Marinilabiliaceae bacterium]|nr:hypothetical protein [Marinilabiliaceae bacterium]